MDSKGSIRLIVGLGNPGAGYEHTRHNVGFLALDALLEEFGGGYIKSESGCAVIDVSARGKDLIFAKPLDYMNTCGGPISKLMRARSISACELLVIHDELDLSEGDVQLRFGGGLNAHNGLRSIKAKLGTADFWRVRAGIGRPPGKMDVASYVLRECKKEQLESLLITASVAAATVKDALAL